MSPFRNLKGGGLRLTFSRDLSQKFRRYLGAAADADLADLHNPDEWKVLGRHQFLRISDYQALKDLDKPAGQEAICRRTFTDLVLVSRACEPPSTDFTEKILRPSGFGTRENPLLAVVSITLSPSVFDFGGGIGQVLTTVDRVIGILRASHEEHAGNCEIAFFYSLSAPDLVILALPQCPKDLKAIERMTRRARTLTLGDVGAADVGFGANECKSHACVSVEPVLAFREEAEDFLGTEEFRGDEKNLGLVYTFHLRVDAGHEDRVMELLSERLEQIESDIPPVIPSFRSDWIHHSLSGTFSYISDVLVIWRGLWFEEDWREEHLIDSAVSLSFPSFQEGAKVHDGPAWCLLGDVPNELATIQAQLEKFAEQVLSKRQGAELLGAFHMFRRCFFRHDLLGTARELLPFFRQLGNALSHTDLWREYLAERAGSRAGRHLFTSQMASLISHLIQAIRNRIEHRSLQSDPPVPHTLDHGACKIISAYSVVFWLGAELFHRTAAPDDLEEDVRPVPGDARSFAGCVCASSLGHIWCEEVFVEFRRFVQRRQDVSGQSGSDLAENPVGAWSQRLLLLDISGPSLLRPEICFVHCLHEMAEVSGWLGRPEALQLRFVFKNWLALEVRAHLYELLDKVVRNGTKQSSTLADLENYVNRYVAYCIAWHGLGKEPTSEQEIGTGVERAYSNNSDHEAFLTSVVSKLQNGAAQRTAIETHLRGIHGDMVIPDVSAAAMPGIINGEEFQARMSNLQELSGEACADIGMWMALGHLLSPPFAAGGQARGEEEQLRDLGRIYTGLLRLVAESYGQQTDRSRIEMHIIRRWAIQAAAVCADREWHDDILKRIAEYRKLHPEILTCEAAVEYLAECARQPWQFGPRNSLVAWLRELEPYGGLLHFRFFGSRKVFQEWEHELFDAFREAWDEADPVKRNSLRIQFVMRLWAVSGRFGLRRVLAPPAVVG